MRCSPRRSAVNPSVARMTISAETSPRSVRATPGAISATVVSSQIATPSFSTASASPRASFAGWILAPCGCHRPPTAPSTRTRAAVSVASHSSTSVCGQVDSSACAARSRASWAALRAMFSSPPLRMSASRASVAATRMTSSTVAFMAACWSSAAWRPRVRTYCSRPPVTELVSQPPLRPDAPNPANRRSSTAIRASG